MFLLRARSDTGRYLHGAVSSSWEFIVHIRLCVPCNYNIPASEGIAPFAIGLAKDEEIKDFVDAHYGMPIVKDFSQSCGKRYSNNLYEKQNDLKG